MSDRPIGLGKVAENGTLNENGAFYSVQDINVLLEEKGGGGGDLPTPTVADAGKAVVVDEEGKYALGEAGGGGGFFEVAILEDDHEVQYLNKNYNEITTAFLTGKTVVFIPDGGTIEDNIFTLGGYYHTMLGYGVRVSTQESAFTAETATGTLKVEG